MDFRKIWIILAMVFIAMALHAETMADRPGFKDPPLFTRMPHYYLSVATSFKESQFDSYEFTVTKGKTTTKERVEGHKLVYCYYFDKSAGAPPSGLQIARNYQNAIAKIGGVVLYDGAAIGAGYNRTTFRVTKDGAETWAEMTTTSAGGYYLTIVERQAMKQDVTANADALKSGLAQNGHVEVAGIFFDFGKSDVKPESAAALKEIAKLLQATPALRMWVVGHTDSVGSAEGNVALSNARAVAIVKYLTQNLGVDAKRLSPHGAGPYAPVAANTTEEGRAKNRRVELVAQ